MTLFLVFSAPLTAVIAYTFIGPRFGGGTSVFSDVHTRRQVFRNPAVVAALSFIPMYALYWLVGANLFSYSPAGLFLHSLLRDYFGWFAVQSTVSFVLVRRIRHRPEQEQYVVHLVVAAVLLTLLSVAELIMAGPVFSAEELFLKPVARILLLTLIPVALTVADNAKGGGWAVLTLILQPLPAAAMTMLHEWIQPGAASLVLVVLALGTGGVLWAMMWREPTSSLS